MAHPIHNPLTGWVVWDGMGWKYPGGVHAKTIFRWWWAGTTSMRSLPRSTSLPRSPSTWTSSTSSCTSSGWSSPSPILLHLFRWICHHLSVLGLSLILKFEGLLVLPGQAKKQQQQKSRDLKRSGEKSQRISFEDKMLFSPKCCWSKYDSDLTGAIIVKSISRISRPTNLRRIFVICLHNISLSVTHYVTCSQKFWVKMFDYFDWYLILTSRPPSNPIVDILLLITQLYTIGCILNATNFSMKYFLWCQYYRIKVVMKRFNNTITDGGSRTVDIRQNRRLFENTKETEKILKG